MPTPPREEVVGRGASGPEDAASEAFRAGEASETPGIIVFVVCRVVGIFSSIEAAAGVVSDLDDDAAYLVLKHPIL